MCGIAGQVALEAAGPHPDREVLGRMGDAQLHRGPDEGSVLQLGPCGFAFRRLSIIDVAGGHQPIANEDESAWIELNGEIYNYLELREELRALGHVFRTKSDAEVVLHGYEQYGTGILDKLVGMFAFAIWDVRKRELILARDRVGKKPLWYHRGQRWFSFASEPSALLQAPDLVPEADLEAIHLYLTYQYVPAPRSAFRGVNKVPPGHFLRLRSGQVEVSRYWDLSYRPKREISEADAADELRALLREAVRCRLMSEVPLGAFLSGGVDSSGVVALMGEFGKVRTFSIGFEEGAFDELPYARQLAQHVGSDHSDKVVRPVAADVLPRLARHFGEPFADSSALPTYYLAKMTAESVTVALSGDGGDELFGGYERYKYLGYDPGQPVPSGWSGRLGRLLGRPSPAEPSRDPYYLMMSYFTPEQKQAVYSGAMKAAVAGSDTYAYLGELYDRAAADGFLDKTLYVETMSYLPEALLVKVDIASMASSLEVRCPFLDHRLIEFAARLPEHFKLRNGTGKLVLKRALAGLVPDALLHRKKMGFGIPLGPWFRGELRDLLRDTLLSTHARQRPFFDPVAIEALIDAHQRGEEHGPRLWALLMLELWCREVLDAAGRARGAGPS